MSLYRYKRVLLADENSQRARIVERTLRQYWRASTQVAYSMDEVSVVCEQAHETDRRHDVVMVAFAFGGFKHTKVFKQLGRAGQKSVLIDDKPDRPLPDNVESLLYVPDDAVIGDPRLRVGLGSIMGNRPPNLPTISNSRTLSRPLRLQIQWLDPQGDPIKGKDILCQLLCQILPDVRSFTVHSIGQGFSGARVFRISCSRNEGPSDFVLKLTPLREDWKCEHEVRSCRKIQKTLGRGNVPFVPTVYVIDEGHGMNGPPAQFSGWTAVLYTLLGGDALVTVDFERVFSDPNDCLTKLASTGSPPSPDMNESLASFFLDKLAEELARLYRVGVRVVYRSLFSVSESQQQRPLSFPPYSFTAWENCKITESIHHLNQYGRSIKRAKWTRNRKLVLSCLSEKATTLEKLQPLFKKRPVLLANVHGDMNANNVLMTLNYGLPFLIDLACFQSEGHIVQDYARLEIAIKIELMGREKIGAPQGLDLNSDTFGKWCTAEDWLCGWPADNVLLKEKVANDSTVVKTYSLCLYVRCLARQVHISILRRLHCKVNFERSYNAAVLYHTVRAIRYDSLPHLKRIFAVYCAGKVMEQLLS